MTVDSKTPEKTVTRTLCGSCGQFLAVYQSASGQVCLLCFRIDTMVGYGDRVTVA